MVYSLFFFAVLIDATKFFLISKHSDSKDRYIFHQYILINKLI